MQKPFILTVSLTAAGLVALGVHPAHADPFLPVPPASFLNYHVSSADQLAEEVAADRVVQARLARHFHQPAPQVARYIRDQLVLTHLAKAGDYKVACVTPSGREFYLNQHLAAGTGVFALRGSGKPILKQACGNPLVATLPAVVQPRHLAPPQLAAAPHTAALASDATAQMPSDIVFTATPPLETAQTGGIGPFVKVAGITQSLGHSGGSGFFPAVLGVAGLGLFAGHHGGSSTPSTPVSPLGPVPPTAPPVTAPPTTPPVTSPTMPPTAPPTTVPPTPMPPTTPPVTVPPVTPPTTPPVTPPFMPPPMAPPTPTPPFIGPPPTVPPSQSAVPEPGPGLIFALGGTALGLLRLRARRRTR